MKYPQQLLTIIIRDMQWVLGERAQSTHSTNKYYVLMGREKTKYALILREWYAKYLLQLLAQLFKTCYECNEKPLSPQVNIIHWRAESHNSAARWSEKIIKVFMVKSNIILFVLVINLLFITSKYCKLYFYRQH